MTSLRVPTLLLHLAVFFLACPTFAAAQPLTVSGTVDDGSGVVPDAAVVLEGSTGARSETRTDRTGRFVFSGLGAGEHRLTISREGYVTLTRAVTVGTTSEDVGVTLQVESVTLSVEVTGVGVGALANNLTSRSTAGSRLDLTSLETPASVTTLSGADIRLRGDSSVNAAVTRAPGITTTYCIAGGGNTVAARGFSGGSVAYLYDGIRNMAGLGNVGWPYDPGPSSVSRS